MKHIFIVCRQEDRDFSIDRLGELGIVHVRDVQSPQSLEIEKLQDETFRVEDALHSLREFEKENGSGTRQSSADSADLGEIKPLTRQILGLLDQLEKAEEDEARWRGIRDRIAPWGGFDRELLNRLEQAGLTIRLVAWPLQSELPELPESVMVEEINRDKQSRYLLLASPADTPMPEEPASISLPQETDFAAIDRHIASACEWQSELKNQLHSLSPAKTRLARQVQHLRSETEFARARAGMGETEVVAYLQGYVPATEVGRLQAAAQQHGWGLLIREPQPDDSQVPTKIRLARWAEPIRLVFQSMGIMPGYWEIDISAWFMIFLSIFFALLFGDAGYGGLFLVCTLVLRKLLPRAPARPFWLFGIFAVATIAWGVITGTYFGIQDNLWPPLAGLRLESMTIDVNVQKLCFFLGALHLTIAHAWNAVIYGRSLKTLAEAAWVAILWANFYLAQVLVLNIEMPTVMVVLYTAGLAGVLVCSHPHRNPLKLIGGGVSALLMGLINSFVDVVSYIRLYAVGVATVAVAENFNQMAAEFLPSWGTFMIGVLILLLGHSLNIVLGLMSVLVHGVRLNVLEFSQHLGLQWAGIDYHPLQRRSANLREEKESRG